MPRLMKKFDETACFDGVAGSFAFFMKDPFAIDNKKGHMRDETRDN
jgi:hypothetical protein